MTYNATQRDSARDSISKRQAPTKTECKNPIFVILYYIISGEEKLSLGVRFVDTTNKEPTMRDEYLGFTSLAQMVEVRAKWLKN